MIPLQDFLSAQTSIYNKSWCITPWQVVTWSLRQFGLHWGDGTGDKLAVGNFVVVASLEPAANAILAHLSTIASSATDLVHSTATFQSTFSHLLSPTGDNTRPLSTNDTHILLTYLSRDHPRIAYDAGSGTIKFAAPSSSTAPPPITENDRSIAGLKTLIQQLDHQVPTLSAQIDALDTKAREAVTNKQRSQALAALRSKKQVTVTYEARSATLGQLRDVLAKIDQAVDQVEMVRVMRSSASVLKSLHAEVGGVEGVVGVVERLQEEMERGDEIGRVVNEIGAAGVDEEEIDEELEALEMEGKAEENAKKEEERKKEEEARREKEEAEVERTRKRLAELEPPKEDVEGNVPAKQAETV